MTATRREEEALRLKGIAETKFKNNNLKSTLKYAKRAQYLPSISETVTILIAASESPNWYKILYLEPFSNINLIRKQFKKLAFILHPDKNSFVGSEEAFKLVGEALQFLSDKVRKHPLLPFLSYSPTPQGAFFLYNLMLSHPSSHNHYTFTHPLKACSSLHAPSKALEIHAHLIKSGHYSDIFIHNSLLHFYLLHNDVVSTSRVFQLISSPDVVSWTSIISGLSKCGFEAEAIEKFSLMDVKPNVVTLVSVLSACSSLKALKFGKAIHGYGLKGMIIDGNVIFD